MEPLRIPAGVCRQRQGDCFRHLDRIADYPQAGTTELYFVRKEEDGEVADRRIQTRVLGCKGEMRAG
jgi:hypothetical protein